MRAAPANAAPNPIIVGAARARLRRGMLLSWGLVVLTITGGLTLTIYTVNTGQNFTTPEHAARLTLIPVIVIQAVLLMLLGTGAVASGVSLERDRGLLDYQRMTPMSPTRKIVGYLFGLPVREYLLFALTLPFAAFGIIKGGIPLSTAAHFYAIFFSSVLVYHMTGLVAGMASSKPRRAGLIAQGMVVLLYFVLPNLSHLGLRFFEFLTIRPAFFGLVVEEIRRASGEAGVEVVRQFTGLDSFSDVAFFSLQLHPSVYTAIVQGFLLVVMWCVVYRKWRDDHAHPFSKVLGLSVYTGGAAFLMASVWPIVHDDRAVLAVASRFRVSRDVASVADLLPERLAMIITIVFLVSSLFLGALSLFVLVCTTPSRHTVAEGWRRVARLGGKRIPPDSDAASSLPLVTACALIGGALLTALFYSAADAGRYPVQPSLWAALATGVYSAAVLLFLQGALERYGMRLFFVAVFMLWVVPFFTFMILVGAFEREFEGPFIAMASTPMALYFCAMNLLESLAPGEGWTNMPEGITVNLPWIVGVGVAGYGVLGAAAQASAARQRGALRRAALEDAHAEEANGAGGNRTLVP